MARVAHSALDSNRGKASSERRNDPRPAVTLDLRPPEFGKIAVDVAAAPARDTMGPQTRDAAALSKLSMERSMSSAEELRRRVHHEGMPVARLFESKSALVSVGLNQHGKPGLWLIQKTH
jgi:hypothetical protein